MVTRALGLDTHPSGHVMVVAEAYRVATVLAVSMLEHQPPVPGETSPRSC